MHNASTKQRLSALRRNLGIFTGWQPRWVRQRKERRERLARSAEADLARSAAAADEATTVAVPPAVEPEHAPAQAPQAEAPAAPQSTIELATVTAAPVGGETAPAGPWYVSRPAATSRPDRGRAVRIALGVALASIATAAGLFVLVRDAPAPGPVAAGHPVELARATGLDARVSVAAPAPVDPTPAAERDATTVEVRRGDCLWRIAAVRLGDPMRWPELHAANAGQVHDPDLIFPGQRLRVPGAARL